MEKLIAREKIRDRIKAVFFDIDGTLVSFETHAVPESARRAIERLRQRGIKVFISTGRLLRHTEVVSDVEVDGYVTVNGSYCVTRGGETIFERSFPHDTVERIFGLCDEMGFQAAFMTHEDIYVDRLSERVLTIAEMIHIMPQVADLRRVASEQPVLQVCPYIDEQTERLVMPHLPECVGSRWIPTFMDLNMRGTDKSVGARKVMEYYGLSMSEAMAFGDGGNDLPIVRDAAVGVAMGNACDTLKAAADYISSSVDEDGVSRALEHFGLI